MMSHGWSCPESRVLLYPWPYHSPVADGVLPFPRERGMISAADIG
jgi:hypothetical protein